MPKHKAYKALGEWCLDSGGYSELSMYGRWTITEDDYLREVERFRGFGGLQWAAPMDWMTEPHITAKTGRTIAEHQRLTIESFVRLDRLMPSTFVPVLQGQSVTDYLTHVRWYADAGVDLDAYPVVGLGSVCRRQATGEIEDIALALQPLRLHGFGCKTSALRRCSYLFASADSMAWSYGGRRRGTCTVGRSRCGNHLHYALEWRDRILAETHQQTHLFAEAK